MREIKERKGDYWGEEDRKWHNRKKGKVQGAEDPKGTMQVCLKRRRRKDDGLFSVLFFRV